MTPTRILLVGLVAILQAGCALQPPAAPLAASTRASAAPASAPANAVCGCKEYFMPAYAHWRDSHRMWSCTVVLPRDGSAPTVPCTAWGLDRAPLGFEVNDR